MVHMHVHIVHQAIIEFSFHRSEEAEPAFRQLRNYLLYTMYSGIVIYGREKIVTIVRQDGCCTQAQKWSRSQVGASIFFGRIN